MAIAGACDLSGEQWSTPDIDRSLQAMALSAKRSLTRRRSHAVVGVCDSSEIAEQARSSGRLLAMFDGRLDNRADLIKNFERDGDLYSFSNADLALHAYSRWGEDFPNRLIGDFSCVIWDDITRELLLCRDVMGTYPLFFWRSGDIVYFATEPRGLLAQAQIPKAVDERWIARWLALLPQNDMSTQYESIKRVPPGEVVSHRSAGSRVHRYWRPEDLPQLRFQDDDSYAAGLRSVLEEAIRCRIGTSEKVGSHLSGGLDSSSVTALAARMMTGERRLTAFTAVPRQAFDSNAFPTRFCDEGPLASLTAETFSNIDHILVPNLAMPVFDAIDAAGFAIDGPVRNPFNQIWANAISESARSQGVTILLTGQMGNMTISYDGLDSLSHLARQRRWADLCREMIALYRAGNSLWFIAKISFEPLLPTALRRSLRSALGRPATNLEDFSAINPVFAERLKVLDEAQSMAGDVSNTLLGQHDVRLAVLRRGDNALLQRGSKRQYGIETTDPTVDRRVVEYCLSVPREQYLRNGETRSLIRRAMTGILPAAVVQERRKGLQAADWHVGATAARAEMALEINRLERSPLARECLDLPRLRRLLDEWPSDGWHQRKTIQAYQLALTRGLATGRFIRRVEGGNA